MTVRSAGLRERARERLIFALDVSTAREAGALIRQLRANQRHQLVTVDCPTVLVDDNQPVGIAIERNADVGPSLQHLGRQRFGCGRAALVVDVAAIGLDADLDDLGAELP